MDIVSSFAIPIITRNKFLQNKYINEFHKSKVEVRPMIAGNMNLQPFFKKYIDPEFALKIQTFYMKMPFMLVIILN